ncbi:hypothetical protein LguiB_017362 [Lonicera macranthoides]
MNSPWPPSSRAGGQLWEHKIMKIIMGLDMNQPKLYERICKFLYKRLTHETMRTKTDIEAFTDALNKYIEGDNTATSQNSDLDRAALSQGSSRVSSQFPYRDGSLNQQQEVNISQELNCLPLQQKQTLDGNPQQQTKQNNSLHVSETVSMQNSENKLRHVQEPKDLDSESWYPVFQKTGDQVVVTTGHATKTTGQCMSFALLIPIIEPQLDKDKAMQMRTLYNKLRVARNSLSGHNNFPSHPHGSVQQHLQKQSISAIQSSDSHELGQLYNKSHIASTDQSQISSSSAPVFVYSTNSTMGNNNVQASQQLEHQSNSNGNQVTQMSSSSFSAAMREKEQPFLIPGLSKQQQQHLHFPQSSFPKYGSTGVNYQPFCGTNINSSTQSRKLQPQDSQVREVPVHRNMGATQLGSNRVQGGTLSQLSNNSSLQHNSVGWQSLMNKEQKNGSISSTAYVKQEQVDQANEQPQKSQVELKSGIPGSFRDDSLQMQSSSMGFSTSTNMLPSTSMPSSIAAQLDSNSSLSSRIPSATSPVGPGSNAKTTHQKPTLGQKKPLEALCSSPPLSGKKQKVSGSFSNQSIEQLNDVAAVSGVNLREEEEQLFTRPREDNRISEALRRVVQEEEERLILQRTPLRKKLAEIYLSVAHSLTFGGCVCCGAVTKCGVKGISNDVERCLSLRADLEKQRHRSVITSDVAQQIIMMNKKAREKSAKAKEQADLETLQKMNENESNTGVDGDKEKDNGCGKSIKGSKDDDENMRTTAANVAARAAVGGDDMLSKWQLMAEQARQKRGGVTDAASSDSSQPGKDVSCNSVATRNARDNNQEAERRKHAPSGPTSGTLRKIGRSKDVVPQSVQRRKISVKDVIAVLEREQQTSKSTLIYRLYEKLCNTVIE